MAFFGSLGFGFIHPATRAWGSSPTGVEFDILPAITDYTIKYDFNNTVFIRQESVLNGHVEFIKKGNRQKCKINFHNCDATRMTNLLASLNQVVKFRPHTDNEDCEFLMIVTEVTPYYLNDIISLDACIVVLESQEYVELVVND